MPRVALLAKTSSRVVLPAPVTPWALVSFLDFAIGLALATGWTNHKRRQRPRLNPAIHVIK